MAKKTNAPKKPGKPQRPIDPPDDDDGDELLAGEAPPPREQDLADDFSAILAGASDATVTVNKSNAHGESYVGKFMASEFDLEKIRDLYGGGTYWFYVRAEGRIKAKRRIVFAQSLSEQQGSEPGARASSPAAGGGADVATVLDRMAQQQQQMLQMVLTAMTANRPQQQDLGQLIDLATKLAGLSGKRESGGDDIERLARLHSLISKVRGDGGGSDSSAVVALADKFISALQAQPSQLPAPANGQGEQQQMVILIRRALAQQIPMLIRGAQAESEPGVYAQLVLDQVPDLYVGALVEFLQRPDWFTQLVQADGRVVPYEGWFAALRNEVIAGTSPETPPQA